MKLSIGCIIQPDLIVEKLLGSMSHQGACLYKYRCIHIHPKKGKQSLLLAFQIFLGEDLLREEITYHFHPKKKFRKMIEDLLIDKFNKDLGILHGTLEREDRYCCRV
jgi:hypothetical protein